jgi:low affinity Fe/Cu permease
MSTQPKQKSLAVRIGDRISDWASKLFAHPYMQIGVIVFCVTWFAIGLPTDLLTAALSILAITLTQMVLNSQYDREAEAHRRDVAMHAKLDELIAVKRGARNDLIGIEEKDEEEIVQLKEEVKEAIEDIAGTDSAHGEAAKQAVDKAAASLNKKASPKPRRKKAAASKP